MSSVEHDQRSRILTFAAQALEQVERIALTPAAWADVAVSVHAMEDALDRGDLVGFDRERRELQRTLPDRQNSRSDLDPEKAPAPAPLRSAAENLSRKIKTERSTEGDAGKKR